MIVKRSRLWPTSQVVKSDGKTPVGPNNTILPKGTWRMVRERPKGKAPYWRFERA